MPFDFAANGFTTEFPCVPAEADVEAAGDDSNPAEVAVTAGWVGCDVATVEAEEDDATAAWEADDICNPLSAESGTRAVSASAAAGF